MSHTHQQSGGIGAWREGSKGNAHIGAVKAMLHQGIQIDFLGGTSAGALYGFGIVFAISISPKWIIIQRIQLKRI
ncbi:MAG: hypothetical protein IPG79_17575 [Saprospiraceae bacterium]|nr:hypothetical protein [Saprospiraceae bacterium]